MTLWSFKHFFDLETMAMLVFLYGQSLDHAWLMYRFTVSRDESAVVTAKGILSLLSVTNLIPYSQLFKRGRGVGSGVGREEGMNEFV